MILFWALHRFVFISRDLLCHRTKRTSHWPDQSTSKLQAKKKIIFFGMSFFLTWLTSDFETHQLKACGIDKAIKKRLKSVVNHLAPIVSICVFSSPQMKGKKRKLFCMYCKKWLKYATSSAFKPKHFLLSQKFSSIFRTLTLLLSKKRCSRLANSMLLAFDR